MDFEISEQKSLLRRTDSPLGALMMQTVRLERRVQLFVLVCDGMQAFSSEGTPTEFAKVLSLCRGGFLLFC